MTDKTTPRPWEIGAEIPWVRHLYEGRRLVATLTFPRIGDGGKEMNAVADRIVAALNAPQPLRSENERLKTAHDALVGAVSELLAAHQRADPHPESSCSNCALARRTLEKAGAR